LQSGFLLFAAKTPADKTIMPSAAYLHLTQPLTDGVYFLSPSQRKEIEKIS
jgi:hypothetical protein